MFHPQKGAEKQKPYGVHLSIFCLLKVLSIFKVLSPEMVLRHISFIGENSLFLKPLKMFYHTMKASKQTPIGGDPC